jgi:hypothetical protein
MKTPLIKCDIINSSTCVISASDRKIMSLIEGEYTFHLIKIGTLFELQASTNFIFRHKDTECRIAENIL